MATSAIIKLIILIALLGGVAWAIHANGRAVEAGECRQRENKELAEKNRDLQTAQAALALVVKKNAALAAANLKLNDEVTSHASKAQQIAATNDALMRRDARGLRLPKETCAAPAAAAGMPGAHRGAGDDNSDGRDGGPRLPSRTETGLYDLTLRANQTRIKRDECREWAIGIQAQREAWEKEQALVSLH